MTDAVQENNGASNVDGGLLSDMPSGQDVTNAPQAMEQSVPSSDMAPAAEHETHASTQHEGGSAGMPQLDPASFPSQLFWLALCFAVMYVLMSRSVLPRIEDVMTRRRERREGDLALADQLTKEAQEAKSAYEKLAAEARHGANQLLSDAEKFVRERDEKESAKLDKVLVEKMQSAEAGLRASHSEARERLAPVVRDVTAEVVRHVTGKAPSDAQLDAALKQAS